MYLETDYPNLTVSIHKQISIVPVPISHTVPFPMYYLVDIIYGIYPKYWGTLTLVHTCP